MGIDFEALGETCLPTRQPQVTCSLQLSMGVIFSASFRIRTG